MLIKFKFFLIKLIIFVSIFIIFFSTPMRAQEIQYLITDSKIKVSDSIDTFFSKNLNESKAIWLPVIDGKSRYAFSIPKDAYYISKKYADTSDLYYLTNKIDNKLSFHQNEVQIINMHVAKNEYKFMYKKSTLFNTNFGIFYQNLKNKSLGLTLDKNFILFENSFGKIDIELFKDYYPLIQTKFVRLNNNENSEINFNFEHEIKSNIFDLGGYYTWFDTANQMDISAGMKNKNKKLYAEIFATLEHKGKAIKLGLNKVTNKSDINIFFNINLKNLFAIKDMNVILDINSSNYFNSDKKLSLKSLRKKNLDVIWRDEMYFD